MANENKESLTIGQALDIIIQNADKRITALETENKVLKDRVERMAAYLNKQKGIESKEKAKPQAIEENDDTSFLASQTKPEAKPEAKPETKSEAKPQPTEDFIKQVLLDKIEDTEETGVDWTIRIKGQRGSSLVLAKYEHEELYNIVANETFSLPYKDSKWSVEQLENGLFKVSKLGKDGKTYFGLI